LKSSKSETFKSPEDYQVKKNYKLSSYIKDSRFITINQEG